MVDMADVVASSTMAEDLLTMAEDSETTVAADLPTTAVVDMADTTTADTTVIYRAPSKCAARGVQRRA